MRQALPCIVFDCDGTLVDTDAYWKSAFILAGKHANVSVDDAFATRMLGSSPITAAALIVNTGDTKCAIQELASTITETLAADMHVRAPEPMPGAHDLLSILAPHFTMAVASNSPKPVLRLCLEASGLAQFFEYAVSADETPRAKPAPDVYLKACGYLSADPQDCIAIEDSLHGAQSAHTAGLSVVSVGHAQLPTPTALHVSTLEDPTLLRYLKAHSLKA